MTRWRLIFCCTLALVAAGVVALWPRGPQEPVYQGKKLSEWIKEANSTPTNAQTEQARLAINAIGTNAIPYLLSEFAARQSRLVINWSEWASRKTGMDFGFDEGNPRRRRAEAGLLLLVTNSAAALPALAAYLGDEERCVAVAWVMGECGEMALPYLLKSLPSTNVVTRHVVIRALGDLTAQTEAAIPPLIQMTEHTDAEIRFISVSALRNASYRMDLVVPALVRSLSDTNLTVQGMAARSLSELGEPAKSAVPDLLLMLQSTNQNRASWASNALHQIDPAALPRAAAP